MSVFELIGVTVVCLVLALMSGVLAFACYHFPNGLSGVVFFGGFAVGLLVVLATLVCEWAKENRATV